MRLCNEYRTAFKEVTDPASVQHLLNAGWMEVVETPEQKVEEEPKIEVRDEDIPTFIDPASLKYKGRYLSWYVNAGTITQLRDTLKHIGVSFDKTHKKKDLQNMLREYLKSLKGKKD